IPNPKSQIPNPKSQIPNPKSQIPNPKSQIPNPNTQIPNKFQIPNKTEFRSLRFEIYSTSSAAPAR
ncbi:MAG TPA: hypothetical protein ENK58_08565, partial [Desulfobacterales bacterium]|nr:hypothetical protein [Desulfobacterales bacterium]